MQLNDQVRERTTFFLSKSGLPSIYSYSHTQRYQWNTFFFLSSNARSFFFCSWNDFFLSKLNDQKVALFASIFYSLFNLLIPINLSTSLRLVLLLLMLLIFIKVNIKVCVFRWPKFTSLVATVYWSEKREKYVCDID